MNHSIGNLPIVCSPEATPCSQAWNLSLFSHQDLARHVSCWLGKKPLEPG